MMDTNDYSTPFTSNSRLTTSHITTLMCKTYYNEFMTVSNIINGMTANCLIDSITQRHSNTNVNFIWSRMNDNFFAQ